MFSASQIVELSCQICKVPGFKTQAGQLLNMVLANLAQVYDFDTERKTITLPIDGSSSFYDLPDDHLRTREVFYEIDGAVNVLTQMPLAEYDMLYKGAANEAYPRAYATMVEADPHRILLYPGYIQATTLTIRYQPQPSDITSPEVSNVIPWFPNQQILLKLLNAELSQLAEDDRMVAFGQLADNNLSKFLTMSDDKEGYARQVQLDGRMFRSPARLRPTKTTLT